MWKSLQNLDRILRGEATQLPQLREGTIGIPAGGLSLVIVVLGMLYGVCMGGYAVFSTGGKGPEQLLASTVKVPTLFLLTLIVTFPSLYVFNALVGSRLNIRAVSRLLVAAIGVNLAVPSIELRAEDFGGREVLVQVFASDGLHTSSVILGPFAVPAGGSGGDGAGGRMP
ncbi:MAG: hypothetical protein HQ567_09200 [Candidatus Nealsonbacteria bacterium]|nr:hypothetical protein [Candidatus Nealsonbacteria bacterium]